MRQAHVAASILVMLVSVTGALGGVTPQIGFGIGLMTPYSFDTGYSAEIGLDLIPDNTLHKLHLEMRYTNAEEKEGKHNIYESINAFTLEMGPMFVLNSSVTLKTYVGLGVSFSFATLDRQGVVSYRAYPDYGEADPQYIDTSVSGVGPGLNLYFKTEWRFTPQLVYTFGAGFRFGTPNYKEVAVYSDDGYEYYFDDDPSFGGFYANIGLLFSLGE